ncbi:hypothetical protein RJ639_001941 [Escallonia herrerae]|uniref:SEC7 domain-containing protein n=1 Tax=Escallonia herrerae TaxID=1293975 RepID=A0AA88XSH1_9ASTE|nr:hypothetical protein RJ639_001941 [Escallonia herrerae]
MIIRVSMIIGDVDVMSHSSCMPNLARIAKAEIVSRITNVSCREGFHEFAPTFDFRDMNLDIALRIFLGTFRLPGESQKI